MCLNKVISLCLLLLKLVQYLTHKFLPFLSPDSKLPNNADCFLFRHCITECSSRKILSDSARSHLFLNGVI